MGMIILETKDLVKKFGKLRALDGVNLKIHSGMIYLLMGPNGSGKTTLINCISGIYKPDEGKIFFKGIDITGKSPHEIAKLGIIRTFQIPEPFKKMSVFENLLAYADNPGENFLSAFFKEKWNKQENELKEKAVSISSYLQLYDQLNLLAKELSGGQLKILEFLKTRMNYPELCLVDEPVGSINPVLANKIFSWIQEIKDKERVTFVVVEHRLDIALKYVDYVYVMGYGKIMCEGSPEKILDNPIVREIYL